MQHHLSKTRLHCHGDIAKGIPSSVKIRNPSHRQKRYFRQISVVFLGVGKHSIKIPIRLAHQFLVSTVLCCNSKNARLFFHRFH